MNSEDRESLKLDSLPALLGIEAAASICCRGMFIPCRAIPSVLARSVRPLVIENEHEYRFSPRGSCTLVRTGKVHLVIFTEHQNCGEEPTRLRIVSGFEGGNTLVPEMFLEILANDGEEYEDLRALKISASKHTPQELTDFFPLPDELPPIQQNRMLIAAGLPSKHSGVEYDPLNVHGGTITIPCSYERTWEQVRGFHTVRIKNISEQEPWPTDGLSGGAIFSIDGPPGGYVANIRGIILRGGSDLLHFVDIEAVKHIATYAA
jgi:hypothetical protein